jgi:hypothetical protein
MSDTATENKPEIREVGANEVMDLLGKAVEKMGEGHALTGATCSYFVLDEPSCIVGHVFHGLGIEQKDLRTADGQNRNPNSMQINNVRAEGVSFTPDAKRVMKVAQQVQDKVTGFLPTTGRAQRQTWGQAIEAARAERVRQIKRAETETQS